ncbi:phage tail protein, partial [Citrobacter freundii]|nr:phage tail protein [Citrobacter freundii]
MTAKYFAILTSQGAAKLANATALGTKLNLTQMAVGDGNGTLPTPDPAQTRLLNQKRIAPLNMLTVDPANTSQIIAEQIIPENEGGFWIREIGLYDDAGVLIAVANCPETYKPQLQEGSGRTQTIRMILIVSSTEAVTLKIDPSVVLATRKYVDDKVIEVKAYADALMAAHLAAADPHSQYATKASPALTGTPNAPTPVKTDNTTRLATTAHVKQVVADYAPLANPALTGKPTAPTAAQTSNDTQLATTAFVKDALAALVDSSPEALDTLNELAAALGDDPNFAATMTAELARKMDKDRNGADIPDVAAFLNNLGFPELGIAGTGTILP